MHIRINIQKLTKVLVLAVAFLWAGYSITAQTQSAGVLQSAPVSALASQSTGKAEQRAANEYAGLPDDVARSVKSVVAVQHLTQSNSWSNAVVASGVILNDHQVLGAGHIVEINGALSCVNINVNAPGLLTPATASSNAVTFASAAHSETTDLALMTVAASKSYKSLPTIAIASKLPKTGDTVYFINYQPKANGTVRDPLSQTSNEPVVFSGTVIGHDSQGLLIAAGGGTSYGHDDTETLLRKGASGGAIVNNKGELVGLSVSSDSLAANRTPQYIGTNYGVSMPDGLYQVVNGQVIDQQLLTRLQGNMTTCQ